MMNHRVVLFVNVKETEYTNNKSRSDMWTDEEKLKILTKSSVPKEFWPLSWLWTNSEVHNFEPSYTSQYHHPHIPLSYYLHLHPQTQYTYFIEQDVRSTSRWTETLPSHKPALLTFQHLCTPPQKWSHLPSCINFPREEMKKGLGAIWGLSTELILATRKYNASCYYEGFLPTVARMESLTTQFHAHALYRKVGRWRGGGTDDLCRDGSEPAVPGEWTYHWEGRGAWQFYEEWKTQGGCWPGALVHPIKS
ncbi:hypothetical protein BCR33DRAFT_499344 [Rhizoclosmatium globosum]|uniref:Uncharacterized protein n=1 Tax=Rhizoclosmatium globosum TaxID=329046 RepID=A0A1Y2CV98_9FUNG|nr:hypothetical protein BCR33DRAFT_499344 [Rhizoclosmatium globosum]|eukprot:ORY50958.1 hypothetical protein BCR33DRAFT_499344 [Rhizoclosmatium globosum]